MTVGELCFPANRQLSEVPTAARRNITAAARNLLRGNGTHPGRRPGPGDGSACPLTGGYEVLTCPRDLNTETGEISLVRGNHATRVTKNEGSMLWIPRSVRCLCSHLGLCIGRPQMRRHRLRPADGASMIGRGR